MLLQTRQRRHRFNSIAANLSLQSILSSRPELRQQMRLRVKRSHTIAQPPARSVTRRLTRLASTTLRKDSRPHLRSK